ncbi:hypothetical protein HOLleu_01351 [Holothuria leucospilota]|uniref:NACHT domain-containing protein n=1 Tax=Holothuria leucospilota TaxID=206669 RepID=A0A9Q1CP77_HOLLE|nr:hypothetical protein HOLleu_01351 [Holothuria leucospilota]
MRSKESWQTIGPYKTIFTDLRARSKRRILEGKTGFGKSTLAFQMAHDWCLNKIPSPLSKFEVLLLLQLQPEDMFSPIMKGLKRSVLPKDCPLRWNDIESVLQKYSALMVLDGYNIDEDRQSEKSCDVMNIMNRKMLKNVDVIMACTVVPKECLKNTKRLRMTGFDDKARDEYVRKAITSDYSDVMSIIEQQFSENPVLKSFSQAPFFFAIIAHMCEETKTFEIFKTTKDFFKLFSDCFYRHTRKHSHNEDMQMYCQSDDDDSKLEKIAFKGLCENDECIVWDREELENEIGQECYNRFVRTGILAEETFVEKRTYKTEVQFAHKLLCDWHAANYISKFSLELESEKVKSVVSVMDMSVLHHLCTSVWELQRDIATFIDYAKDRTDYIEFATRFIFQNNIHVDNIWDCAVELCSQQVLFTNKQSEMFQRSMIHLLDAASDHKVKLFTIL